VFNHQSLRINFAFTWWMKKSHRGLSVSDMAAVVSVCVPLGTNVLVLCQYCCLLVNMMCTYSH